MENNKNNVVPMNVDQSTEAQERRETRIKRAVSAYSSVYHAERELDRKKGRLTNILMDLRPEDIGEYAERTNAFDRRNNEIDARRAQKRGY